MTHREITVFKNDVVKLINSLIRNKIANFHINHTLDRNMTLLELAVKHIEKAIPQEVKDLEEKAQDLALEKIKDFTSKEKEAIGNLILYGLKLLSKKEQARHEELFQAHEKYMEEENTEFTEDSIIRFEAGKVGEPDIEYLPYLTLKRFMPKEAVDTSENTVPKK